MTPLLILAILATPTTPPTTIHTTTHQEAPMAQPTPNIPYPERHPTSGPVRGPGTTFQRIGRDASNPQMSGGARPAHGNTLAATGRNLTPTEHTARPTPR